MDRIKFSINQATTLPTDFETDIKTYHLAGFKAIEIWFDKLQKYIERSSLQNASSLLKKYNLICVGACAQGDLMLSKGRKRKEVIKEFIGKLEICQYLEIPCLVVPTDFPEKVREEDYTGCIQNLKEAGDIAEKYNIKLAIEFIANAKFIGSLSTAVDITQKVSKKNVGILFDTFHFYTGISKFEDIDNIRIDNLFLVHLNDIPARPREILMDKDRVLPGKGILPLKKIIKKFTEMGYNGYYSLELFNPEIWKMKPYNAVKKCYNGLNRFIKELENENTD